MANTLPSWLYPNSKQKFEQQLGVQHAKYAKCNYKYAECLVLLASYFPLNDQPVFLIASNLPKAYPLTAEVNDLHVIPLRLLWFFPEATLHLVAVKTVSNILRFNKTIGFIPIANA